MDMELKAIGTISSSIRERAKCPKQGHEGAPDAWITVKDQYQEAMDGLAPGQEVLILTWLHEADREVLKVRPRGRPENPLRGVFSTRSPARPNPIGLHPVRILEVSGNRLHVEPLDAIDQTPVLDIKLSICRENI
ncbi:MAG: tRNA (N6-threonylcarbamoyladenosine(37)-N6)-methyltransferase TrmO [Desulfovibrionaceae bacterium]|nr:tRNA (N6-threonylcarbamoyladenosine(37)-N6)-methyltransferase TrmO [Desulfovibrionaceae bacterium]